MNRVYETIPYFQYVSTDRYWQMLLDHSLKQIRIKMYILKTYIELCRLCAILYTYVFYYYYYYYSEDPAPPLHTVYGAVL